ncbi:MAG: siphovirus Gp157 family protein [Bacteroidetes bacterium]|nr:siphovirus Gp157 family protein [Bacteroidota bacterium]
MNTFMLEQRLRALLEAYEESGGETNDALDAEFDELMGEFGQVGDALDALAVIASEHAMLADFRSEQARVKASSAKAETRKADRAKAAMLRLVDMAGGKVTTPSADYVSVKNGGVAPLDIDQMPAKDLPERFRVETITYSPDKTRIREALARGETLHFARLLGRGSHLRVTGEVLK